MRNNYLHNIKEIIFVTFIWIATTLFYVYIKFNSIPVDCLMKTYGADSIVSKGILYEIALVVSIFIGLILGVLYTLVYPKLYRNNSFLTNLIIRMLIFVVISAFIFILIFNLYGFNVLHAEYSHVFIYMLLTENIVGLLIILKRNLGRGYFRNTFTNTYRNPKEEIRVFMFLDMENSTPTAEKMGNIRFTRFIQDCFYDLSDVVLKHNGEIYQFVGDEAVITWKVNNKFNYQQCISLYFSYMKLLKEKSSYYQKKYNHTPVFRCAVHCGKVSTALVGDYKKEIAYHGDVLNLCARLQAACKENNAYMLISEKFYSRINTSNYLLTSVVIKNLKGIKADQLAYKVFQQED